MRAVLRVAVRIKHLKINGLPHPRRRQTAVFDVCVVRLYNEYMEELFSRQEQSHE